MLRLDGSPQACNFIRVDFNLFNQARSHRFNKYRDILPQFAQSLAEDVVFSRCLKFRPLDHAQRDVPCMAGKTLDDVNATEIGRNDAQILEQGLIQCQHQQQFLREGFCLTLRSFTKFEYLVDRNFGWVGNGVDSVLVFLCDGFKEFIHCFLDEVHSLVEVGPNWWCHTFRPP